MTDSFGLNPGETDLITVEQRLTALWDDLSPAQRMVLDTIIGAGLSLATADDTSGYTMLANPDAARIYMQSRMAELQRDWRETNTGADGTSSLRWDLRPLMRWFHQTPAAPAPSTTRGATA